VGNDNRKLMCQWLRKARRQGYDVVYGGNGHYRVTHPTDGRTASVPSTPGGGRSERNTRALLRRLGVDV